MNYFLGVGKTTLFHAIIHEESVASSESSQGCMYLSKLCTFDNESFMLQIWDTAGQEKYKAIAPVYLRDTDIVVFVCDLTRKDSFFGLNDWIQLAKNYTPASTSWVFVGNKSDQPAEAWDVSEKNIAGLSSKYTERTSSKYFLTSGINYQGIVELLGELARISHGKWKEKMAMQGSGISTRLKKKMGIKTDAAQKSKCC